MEVEEEQGDPNERPVRIWTSRCRQPYDGSLSN